MALSLPTPYSILFSLRKSAQGRNGLLSARFHLGSAPASRLVALHCAKKASRTFATISLKHQSGSFRVSFI
jgi:hypothetical protein